MRKNDVYAFLNGNQILLNDLDQEERRLLTRLRRRIRTHPDWCDFDDYWLKHVAALYDGRRVSRKATIQKPLYRIAQDMGSRIGIAQGYIRPRDYRDELKGVIRDKFKTRREFCKATGLSEDMLSHVLAGRKDLSLSALTEALSRIGYRLKITPAPERKRTG